jgi:hypothetical protein
VAAGLAPAVLAEIASSVPIPPNIDIVVRLLLPMTSKNEINCIIYLPEFKKLKILNYFFVFNTVGRGEGVGVRRTGLAVFSP